MANVRRWCGDPIDHPPPELGLPCQIVIDGHGTAIGVATVEPVGQDIRPLHSVCREQSSQPRRDGVPATPPQLGIVARVEMAEMLSDRPAPGLIEGGIQRC